MTSKELDGVATVSAPNLQCTFDRSTGVLRSLESTVGSAAHRWLDAAPSVGVRNEHTEETAVFSTVGVDTNPNGIVVRRQQRAGGPAAESAPGLELDEEWSAGASGLCLDLSFSGHGERVGHEVTLDFPILTESSLVFTPSERGIMSVAAHPDYEPVAYGSAPFATGFRYYVMPFVTVLDPASDRAVTIALPPDSPIPHLQVEWRRGKTLRLRLANRGMGSGASSELRLLLYAHEADYRSALRVYSDDFPAYFRPGLPRGDSEGAFYYHHIHTRPDDEEMARQNLKFFWAGHHWNAAMGEFLPEESEWEPITFEQFGRVSDGLINSSIDGLKQCGIGTYAYFSLTEYGGGWGEESGRRVTDRKLREEFAPDVMKAEDGEPIESGGGGNCLVMNPRGNSAFGDHLEAQARLCLTRFPDLEGFSIDRLDWASAIADRNPSGYDFANSDGFTMVGNRPAHSMATGVAEGLRVLCDLSHGAGKRVFANQAWRLDVLRDVDGHVQEYDCVRGIGYVSPYRPATGWNSNNYHKRDLLQFEAQLKRRLQFAVFPHMIAREFAICQQGPNAAAAAMLERFELLFSRLDGKEQVLAAHCVSVSGSNEANLFVNRAGDDVVPITSNCRFISRGSSSRDTVTARIRMPNAGHLEWAHVYSADGPPYRAEIEAAGEEASVVVRHHGTSSMVVTGTGAEPELQEPSGRGTAVPGGGGRPEPAERVAPLAERPRLSHLRKAYIRLEGVHVGDDGRIVARADNRVLGALPASELGPMCQGYGDTSSDAYPRSVACFHLPLADGTLPQDAPVLELVRGDEGTWFVSETAEMLVEKEDGTILRVARWAPDEAGNSASGRADTSLDRPFGLFMTMPLAWCGPAEIPSPKEDR